MNFSISGGIGLIGFVIIFGAVALAFAIVMPLIASALRGRDDRTDVPPERPPEDDYLL